MELILITYERFFNGEDKCIQSLMQEYSFTLHLRKPGATVSEYRALLNSIAPVYHRRIMLHDAFELSEEFSLKGLHFSTKLRHKAKDYPQEYKSTSCHSIAELEEVGADFDSLFISPVFPSISKVGYNGNLDVNTLLEFMKHNSSPKVIALGGIDHTNIAQVAQWSFSRAALMGAVWGADGSEIDRVKNNLKNIIECIPNDHTA